MSENRIPRKHFLAALGIAAAGIFGAGSRLIKRPAASRVEGSSLAELPVPATDPRSVSRPAQR